jgi:hypothetical protein
MCGCADANGTACEGIEPPLQYLDNAPVYTTDGLDHWVKTRLGRPRVHTRQHSLGARRGDLFPTTAEPVLLHPNDVEAAA